MFSIGPNPLSTQHLRGPRFLQLGQGIPDIRCSPAVGAHVYLNYLASAVHVGIANCNVEYCK